MTIDDAHRCYWLMLRARDLIAEALDQHIYDASNGEFPEPDCQYERWLRDCTAYLSKGVTYG